MITHDPDLALCGVSSKRTLTCAYVKPQGNCLYLQLNNFNTSMTHIGVIYIIKEGFPPLIASLGLCGTRK